MNVLFPSLSEENPETEGVLAIWYVADGEHVAEGQLLAEVQVDKVSAEVTAPGAGVISLLAAQDEAVVQGKPIAVIGT